jgi:hypothetical protein
VVADLHGRPSLVAAHLEMVNDGPNHRARYEAP